jgi:hypothetical protein
VATGAARPLFSAPETLRGSYPVDARRDQPALGRGRPHRFLSYADGWPHLYSVSANGRRAAAARLMPRRLDGGVHHLERRPAAFLVYAANAGPAPTTSIAGTWCACRWTARLPEVLTPGPGLEWTPVVTGERAVESRYLARDAAATARCRWCARAAGAAPRAHSRTTGCPRSSRPRQLVTPKPVTYKADDGLEIHAQLFERAGGAADEEARDRLRRTAGRRARCCSAGTTRITTRTPMR